MLTSTLKFWRMTFSQACSFTTKTPRILFSSRTMIQSTLAKRPRSGFKPMDSMSCHGQLSPQTSIQLSIFGNHLKRRLGEYENAPGGMQKLWERVEVEWDKIGADTHQKLIESMPRRVDAVIRVKGGYTKY